MNILPLGFKYPFSHYVSGKPGRNGTIEEWRNRILEEERNAGNKDITPDKAKEYLDGLIRISRDAEQKARDAKRDSASANTLEKIRKGIFVKWDKKTELLRGRNVPVKRESLGLKRGGKRGIQSQDSQRSRHDLAPYLPRHEALLGIQQREQAAGFPCDEPRSEQIMENGRKNGWLMRHEESSTWGGSRATPPEGAKAKRLGLVRNLTDRQRYWWDVFGTMPPMQYTGWRDIESCGVLRWTVERYVELGETITAEEADRRYHAAWNSSSDPVKKPFFKNRETKMVRGRNHYVPGVFIGLPRFEENSPEFWFWALQHLPEGSNVERLLEQAIERGDVMTKESPVGGPRKLMGRKLYDEWYAKQKTIEEAQKIAKERGELVDRLTKSNKRLRPWFALLADPESDLSKAICEMPLFNGGADGNEDWPDSEDALFGPAEWLKNKYFPAEAKWGEDQYINDNDQAITIILTAQDMGYCVYSDELRGRHGRGWKPLEKAA